MPGDPARAARIAASVLQEPRVVSDVRGIQIHTGTVDGKPLSVMASGMGMPSMTLYATELFRFYGVTRIVRLGTAGALAAGLHPGDAVIATGAHTTSSMNELWMPGVHFSAVADFPMASAAMAAAAGDPHVMAGLVISNDHFYRDFMPGFHEMLTANGVLATEMETAGLYGVAQSEGKAALAVLTVSNHMFHDENMSSAQRETTFDRALKLALAAALH